jgi:hypothetical protein
MVNYIVDFVVLHFKYGIGGGNQRRWPILANCHSHKYPRNN